MFKTCLLSSLLLAALRTEASGADLTGKNCDLEIPPLSAGYSTVLGVPLRVYPSHTEISARYSGCQVIWVMDGAVEKVEMKFLFERGKPKQMVGGSMSISFDECTNGAVDTDATGPCELAATLPYKSYAKECLKTRTQPADSIGMYIDRKCMQMPDRVSGGEAGSESSKP